MSAEYAQGIIEDVGIWGGATIPIVFIIQYTYLADWWRSETGKAIVALDACVWLATVPLALELAHVPIPDAVFEWAAAIGVFCVPFVILYRIGAFEVKRRRYRYRDRLLVVPPRHDGEPPSRRSHHRRSA